MGKRCPVCGASWGADDIPATARNVAHLVEEHAWAIKHAINFLQDPAARLSVDERDAEISRLKAEIRKLNRRIAWLKRQDSKRGGAAA